MVDLSGGRRATKGLTLNYKCPRLRHFQMGAPPPPPPPLPDPLEHNMWFKEFLRLLYLQNLTQNYDWRMILNML